MNFAKKFDFDKLDIDKSEPISIDLSKLTNLVSCLKDCIWYIGLKS